MAGGGEAQGEGPGCGDANASDASLARDSSAVAGGRGALRHLSPVARRILERAEADVGMPVPQPRVPGPFARAESEDDDGYDPYSDRPAAPDAQWQPDPWR